MINPLTYSIENKDILFLIFDFLPAESLCSASKTCKKWNTVYKNNKFSYNFSSGKSINNKKLHLIKNLNVDRAVTFYSSKLKDKGILGLCENNKIRKIRFINNFKMNITDKSVIKLSETVEEIEFFNCFLLTNISIQSLVKNKKIKTLNICGNENITNEAFIGLNFIENLYLNDCDKITNDFLKYISNDCLKKLALPNQINSFKNLNFCNLTELYLYSSNIRDEELKNIKTERLKILILTWCKNITDKGIENFKGKHFEKLGLRCSQITDLSLFYVSATDLDIWGTSITDEGFLYLDKTFKLSIGEMHNISSNCLQYLSHITYLLAPRTSISHIEMKEFQNKNPHINFNPRI